MRWGMFIGFERTIENLINPRDILNIEYPLSHVINRSPSLKIGRHFLVGALPSK
jgi:hypothetical protein